MKFDLRSRSAGFTSLEVLAATVLAASLMVAVLGVLSGIAKKEALLENSKVSPAWHAQVTRQLEKDLRATHELRRQPGRLILRGHGGRSPDQNVSTWLPTEIHYYSAELKEGSLLLRQEVPVDPLQAPAAPEIIAWGASKLDLLVDAGPAPTGLAGISVDSTPVADGVLPERLQVVILSAVDEEPATPLYRQRFFLY